jgi:hypothetical protein
MGDISNKLDDMAVGYDDKFLVDSATLPGTICHVLVVFLEHYFVLYYV